MIKYLMSASLGVGEIILIIVCGALVISAIVTAIIRKFRGKPSCGGDCGCCSNCSNCKSDKTANNE